MTTRASWPALVVPLLLAATVLGSCEDLRQFTGSWAGRISRDPNHQHGFPADAMLRARVTGVSRYGIDLEVTLPGATAAVPFTPMRHAADDILADAQLTGDPLRTYFGFVRAPAGEAYLAVVSIFSEDRLEVRLIRGPEETYAVFYMTRLRPADGGT